MSLYQLILHEPDGRRCKSTQGKLWLSSVIFVDLGETEYISTYIAYGIIRVAARHGIVKLAPSTRVQKYNILYFSPVAKYEKTHSP